MTYIDEWRQAILPRLVGTAEQGRSGGDRPRFDWMGIDSDLRRHTRPHTDRASAPVDNDHWDPPVTPKYGMTSRELADYQKQLATYARGRILGVGNEQYDYGMFQKFENMTIDELWTGAREEIADLINYVTMLDIMLGRLVRTVDEHV